VSQLKHILKSGSWEAKAAMALMAFAIVVPLFFEQWELSIFILIMFGFGHDRRTVCVGYSRSCREPDIAIGVAVPFVFLFSKIFFTGGGAAATRFQFTNAVSASKADTKQDY